MKRSWYSSWGHTQLSGELLASLLAYRIVYYFVPFVIAVGMLTARELGAHRRRLVVGASSMAQGIGRWSEPIVPSAIGVMTMGGGAVLLVSGATPALPSRVAALLEILPLGLLEVSHFTGSFVGAMLLMLGYALTRRLDAAWHATRALLVVGIGATLLKGFDYEEALALGVVLLFLSLNREAFHRRSSLLAEPLTPEWIVAVVAIIGASVWVGVFSFKHVEYSADLWWRFAERGDVPRFLRASVGAVGAIALIATARLLRQSAQRLTPPAAETLVAVRAMLGSLEDTTASLALLGDKQLLLSERGTGFLMFGVSGQSFIAMGDPFGTEADRQELGWQLRDLADANGASIAFYEVSAASLAMCVDLGLTLLKIGESAAVPLAGFSLDGGARRGLRRTHGSLTKLGATFEVVDASCVADLMPDLRRISDDWLLSKSAREKGFSLGRFDPDYLVNFPLALVRIDGRLVCFANLWCGDGHELSPDLMRYPADAPPSVMEFLFVSLMLWGREKGFARMNLGMAPLAGLQSHRSGPLSQRLGAVLYRHGEHFYNFQGLRSYKDKFDPVWEPRYLACEGGLALPGIITNIASLISGGISGLVTR